MSNLPKPGSIWTSPDNTRFRVINTVLIETDGHTWVHYIQEKTDKEYSCYLESFLQRFRTFDND
jgi:hypothetical protein